MRTKTTASILIAVLAGAALMMGARPHAQRQSASGLVTALDQIAGNLLGTGVFDVVLVPGGDNQPATLAFVLTGLPEEVMGVAPEPFLPNPVEFIAAKMGGSPQPFIPFFRMTVGAPDHDVVLLEFDPAAAGGGLCPIVEGTDLSRLADTLGAAIHDTHSAGGRINTGLVTAFDRVGKNVLGSHNFEVVLGVDPQPFQPLRITVAAAPSPIDFIVAKMGVSPTPFVPFFRARLGERDSLQLEFDSTAAGRDFAPPVVDCAANLGGVRGGG